MDFNLLRKVLASDLTCPQRMILTILLNHTNANGSAWPSQETIAKQAGLTDRGVRNNIDHLTEKGWLEKRTGTGRGYIYKIVEPERGSAMLTISPEPDSGITGTPFLSDRNEVPDNRNAVPTNNLELPNEPPIEQTKAPKAVSKAKGSEEELKAYAEEIGVAADDGSFLFDNWESNGWKSGSGPLKDWRAAMRKWKRGGWLPSQKTQPSYQDRKSMSPSEKFSL